MIVSALGAVASYFASIAMDIAAVLILVGAIAPLDGLGKWASVVLLVGASAATASNAERLARKTDRLAGPEHVR